MLIKNITFCVISLFVINFFTSSSIISQDKKTFPVIQGKITGKVFDKDLNAPIESVTIQLFKAKDSSLVTGTTTNSKGEYMLDTKGGRFKLKASYIGYNTAVIINIMVTPENKEIALETIKLESGSTTITEIDVTAERSYYEAGIDKKIYNIDKDLNAQGGNALDALKNIPSVAVDIDGNVSMRGSGNLNVLINGRKSNFAGDITSLLEQIPADQIETIEIITNPSSKYDPEGNAGIINIILKKEQEAGYNWTLNLNSGTGDKYNASTSLGIRKGKFNFSVNYGLRSFRMGGNGNSFRKNLLNDSIPFFQQNSISSNKMLSNIGGLGIDYDFNNKISLGFSGRYNYRTRNSFNKSDYANLLLNLDPLSSYERNNFDGETGNGFDLSLDYRMKFDKPKQELTALVNYNFRKEDQTLNINEQDFAGSGTPLLPLYLENDYTTDKDYDGVIQVDYYHPLGEDAKLEFGYKSDFTKMKSDFRADVFDFNQQAWINNDNVLNNFEYNTSVHALYGIYGTKLGSFAFQVGLRAEQTFTKSDQITQNKSFDKNYFSIFPSIYLTQSLSKTQDIQLSYTRRINRPHSWFLNPFIDYSDPQNLRVGNPELNPEYINAVELGYLKYFKSFSVTSSIFYKLTNDVINRITTLTDSNVTMTTFKNLSKSSSYGFEFITSGQLLNWWFLNGNFSYYRSIVQGNYGTGELDNSSYTWSARVNSSFSFPNLFDLQIAYNYNGKNVTAQGNTEPFQSVDLAIKRDFLNKRITLGFRVSDVFNSFKFNSTSIGTGFEITNSRKRDSRVAFLTFTYRLGDDKTMNKKKPKKDDNENNGNPEDY
jgi:outer membrane receptor protein involved in Fe transport